MELCHSPTVQNASLPPHLIESNGEKRCSVCQMVFDDVGTLAVSRAFIAHIREKHKPHSQEEIPSEKKPPQKAN